MTTRRTPAIDCDLIEVERFRAWAKSKGDSFAGAPRRDISCPIALYLNDNMTAAERMKDGKMLLPSVRPDRIALRYSGSDRGAYGSSCETPPWARKFINAVDRVYQDGLNGTAVVRILDRLFPESQTSPSET